MKFYEKPGRETPIKWVLTVLVLASIGFNIYQFLDLKKQNEQLYSYIDQYEEVLSATQMKLSSTTHEKLAIKDSLQKEKENTNFFQNQIQTLAGTVGVLEKLSKTDSELLKKYSKVYFLNENYNPPQLVNIDNNYLLQKEKQVQIHAEVWPHLQKMLDASLASGVSIEILSAFRSFDTQTSLKSAYKVTYGSGANKFSADQGYSEHQLGTTLDFTTPKIGAVLSGFDKTAEYKWLQENAHKYGFILSYPKENSYYIFEPWHWRFVGVDLATKLFENKLYFYSLDQREIDQFLVNLFN